MELNQATISTLQEKLQELGQEKCQLLNGKDEKQFKINDEMNDLQEEIRSLQEENSVMRQDMETANVESAKTITDLQGRILTLEKMQYEKDQQIAELTNTLACSQET